MVGIQILFISMVVLFASALFARVYGDTVPKGVQIIDGLAILLGFSGCVIGAIWAIVTLI